MLTTEEDQKLHDSVYETQSAKNDIKWKLNHYIFGIYWQLDIGNLVTTFSFHMTLYLTEYLQNNLIYKLIYRAEKIKKSSKR